MMACEYQCGAEHDGAPRSARRGAPACTGRSGCSPAAGGTGCSRRARCWRRPGRCAPGRGAAPRARAAPPTRPPGAAAAGAARLRAAPARRRSGRAGDPAFQARLRGGAQGARMQQARSARLASAPTQVSATPAAQSPGAETHCSASLPHRRPHMPVRIRSFRALQGWQGRPRANAPGEK